MEDHLLRVVSRDGLLRGVAAVTTGVVTEICGRQRTDLTATVALGRLLTGGVLLSCLLKGKQRLALFIEGNGPLGKLAVETDAEGNLRGSIKNPVAGLPPKSGRFDVAAAIGKAGFLHVWKDLGLKEPYQSMVQLQTSEVAEDLAWYLASSEQIPSSVSLGVELDSQGSVAAAGGILVQSLPPGDAEQVGQVIERLQQLPPVTSMLRKGIGPLEILQQLFGGIEFVASHRQSLEFYCPCTREQITAMLRGVGLAELRQLADERGEIEVVCEYCQEKYAFSREQISMLDDKA